MRISNELDMLTVSAEIMGKSNIIYPALFHDKDSIILVDTGFPNQLQQFIEAFEKAEVPFDMINKIIITHQDIDHVGSLPAILSKSDKHIETLTHQVEKPYLEGDCRPVKLAALESKLNSLPEQMKNMFYGLKAFYDSNKIKIDKTVSDGELLPYCSGITVIYTPGHTPGHICLYHNKSKTLIAGDALDIKEGLLTASPDSINFDQNLYITSLKKLATYDIKSVICYHGGLFKGEVTNCISDIAESLSRK